QGDERTGAARTHPVYSTRNQFLAGAGFAEDQHCGIGGSDEFDLTEDAVHRRAAADDLHELVFEDDDLVLVLARLCRGGPLIKRAQFLYEGDPAKWGELQNGGCHQNLNAGAVLADQFLLKRGARPESQTFFVGQFVECEILRWGEVRPSQAPGQQVFAGVTDQFEEGVVGFGNAVELAGYDTGDQSVGRYGPETGARAAQFLITFAALAKIAHHSREPLQFPVFVFQRDRDYVPPESLSILSHAPAFAAEMALGNGPVQLLCDVGAPLFIVRVEHRNMFIDDLGGCVAIDTLGARIPSHHRAVHIQEKNGVVLYPGGNLSGRGAGGAFFVAEDQDMAHRQDIGLDRVLNLA